MQKKQPQNSSRTKPSAFGDWPLFLKTGIFGLVLFALSYSYSHWMKIPGELNKSMADTAILLIGLSMVLGSVSYFWKSFVWALVYRKYLGLIGFAFGVAHLLLSWGAFLSLLNISTWQQGKMWPVLSGAIALIIFAIMTAVSNSFLVRRLGTVNWKRILQMGYVAILFVLLHVVLLKSGRWVTWYQGGMKTLPSLSLVVTLFIVLVVVMRISLEWSLRRKKLKR